MKTSLTSTQDALILTPRSNSQEYRLISRIFGTLPSLPNRQGDWQGAAKEGMVRFTLMQPLWQPGKWLVDMIAADRGIAKPTPQERQEITVELIQKAMSARVQNWQTYGLQSRLILDIVIRKMKEVGSPIIQISAYDIAQAMGKQRGKPLYESIGRALSVLSELQVEGEFTTSTNHRKGKTRFVGRQEPLLRVVPLKTYEVEDKKYTEIWEHTAWEVELTKNGQAVTGLARHSLAHIALVPEMLYQLDPYREQMTIRLGLTMGEVVGLSGAADGKMTARVMLEHCGLSTDKPEHHSDRVRKSVEEALSHLVQIGYLSAWQYTRPITSRRNWWPTWIDMPIVYHIAGRD